MRQLQRTLTHSVFEWFVGDLKIYHHKPLTLAEKRQRLFYMFVYLHS